jgi:hypothetical protein
MFALYGLELVWGLVRETVGRPHVRLTLALQKWLKPLRQALAKAVWPAPTEVGTANRPYHRL